MLIVFEIIATFMLGVLGVVLVDAPQSAMQSNIGGGALIAALFFMGHLMVVGITSAREAKKDPSDPKNMTIAERYEMLTTTSESAK